MLKLFMIIIGGKPVGRHIEQHDVFFGVGDELQDLYPEIDLFWPEIAGKWHIDSWREVTYVDGYEIKVVPREDADAGENGLYFINLGGYKENDLEEYHYKLLTVGSDKGVAVKKSKQTAFYKHTGFKAAGSHVDDKYGIDVDDLYELEDLLTSPVKTRFGLSVIPTESKDEDLLHIGYIKPR